MEELYVEGVAIHGGPESCVGAREGAGEALTGARIGQAIEPRNPQFGVPTLSQWRKATRPVALCEALVRPRAVKEPWHVRNLQVREPGEPTVRPSVDHRAGRSGNAKAVSLR